MDFARRGVGETFALGKIGSGLFSKLDLTVRRPSGCENRPSWETPKHDHGDRPFSFWPWWPKEKEHGTLTVRRGLAGATSLECRQESWCEASTEASTSLGDPLLSRSLR